MACASCGKNSAFQGTISPVGDPNGVLVAGFPFGANDLRIVDGDEIRSIDLTLDWKPDRHKLLIFIPQTFTPVCQTELGALNQWYDEFDKLDCDLIAAGTDQASSFKDWYSQEPSLANPKFKTFSSYLLPSRLGIMENGRSKRASVFVTAEGEVVKQECFLKVGRSLSELHRTLFGYTTGSYCAEGWESPADGFLEPPAA